MEFISITNDPKVAEYFESCGIDDIMVDLEILGKKERQKGLNTVLSAHNIEDISIVKSKLKKSKCLVRINPVHDGMKKEIEEVITRKADILMLPMFKNADEVELFINSVGDRAQKYLLLETAQALVRVDDIISCDGIDAIHIGLNDLSISLGLGFLYEPLIGGIVEYLAQKIRNKNIKFGFGGVSRLEKGKLILSEHFRLGSRIVILNRHFRYYKETYDEIVNTVDIKKEINKITDFLKELENCNQSELEKNRLNLIIEIKKQAESMDNI
jgi:2-keto-3-deoxy-L-rhamnonate aldolase RhmA